MPISAYGDYGSYGACSIVQLVLCVAIMDYHVVLMHVERRISRHSLCRWFTSRGSSCPLSPRLHDKG